MPDANQLRPMRDRWRSAPWLAAFILLLSLVAAGEAFVRERARMQATERDNALIIAAERLLSSLKDVETGERGFIITGRDPYLEPYNGGVAATVPDLDRVRGILGPAAQALSDLVAERLAEAAQGVATYRRDGAAAGAASIQTGAGKATMDRVRVEVARIQQAANDRLARDRKNEAFDNVLRLGSIVGLLASCVALGTLAVQRRRQQRASQLLFEGVLENATVGVGIVDREMRLRHVNPALDAMSERPDAAGRGASVWEVLPRLRNALEPYLKQVVAQGRPISAEVMARGDDKACERSYQINIYPVEPGAAARSDLGMILVDVTAHKDAERRTKASEERFRTLAQSTAAMIWTAGPEGTFVTPQRSWARFTGQPAEEMLGWGRLACVHPDDIEATETAWRAAKKDGTPIALEHRLRRADGAWRYMALNVAPVRAEDGLIREWVGSHTDITERKEAEHALEEAKQEAEAAREAAEGANRAKSAFLANMSHELRTPLSAVIGYSEMLGEELEDVGQAELLPDLRKIEANAKHLLGLINDVLDLSKVEAQKMDVYAEDITVADFVCEAAATVETLIGKKNNRLVVDLAPDLGEAHTDVTKLRQCLFNLLSNAAKFTEQGTITLSARRETTAQEDRLVFAVRDTGIGMSTEQLDRLFQRFSQADETTTRKFGGTGLGLALSRAFAQLLGGDITVESKEREGTCFTLRVPARLPAPAADALSPAVIAEARAETRDLVLVIDDEASQRELMIRFLERQGFAARAAADGRSGLELARALKPRVILLDVMMPEMDGWSVLRALKDDPELVGVPVVMVSFVADASLSASLGAVGAVPKPVNWARLKAVLSELRASEGDVLIVDDDPEMRERLRSALGRSGWSVREAQNGLEALDEVRMTAPRLILLDLTMPVMDGFAFLHQLRAMDSGGDIPVVVLTARDITTAESQELQGADRVLRKDETSLKEVAENVQALAR